MFVRKLVSGKRVRFEEEGVNLDLTYITSRVIAMSYPSSGFESMYRNPVDKVNMLLTLYRFLNFWMKNTTIDIGS